MSTGAGRALLVTTAALLCALFLALGLQRIALPGLDYDETLFVNAALGGHEDNFVHARWLGIPTMVMPYIGALKAWLHAPVFALFGVSPATIRVPSVLLACAMLLVTWRLMARIAGELPAITALLMLATDPALVMTARADYGPVVLMLLLKVLATWACFALVARSGARAAWALAAATALGMFDKLNFLWFAVALTAATVVVHPRALRDTLRSRATWLPLAVWTVAVALVGAQSVRLLRQTGSAGDPGEPLPARAARLLGLTGSTFDGRGFHEFLLGTPLSEPTWLVPYLGLALLVLALALVHGVRGAGAGGVWSPLRAALWFVAGGLVLFTQMVATPQAGGGHHVMMLWPTHHLVLCSAAAALPSRALRVAVLAACVPFALAQVRTDLAFTTRLDPEHALATRWNPAIYRLAEAVDQELQRQPADHVFAADWGLHNQLFALAAPGQRARFADLWPTFGDPIEARSEREAFVLRQWFAGHEVLLITHTEGHDAIPGTRQHAVEFAQRRLEVRSLTTIADAQRQPLFEIRRVRG